MFGYDMEGYVLMGWEEEEEEEEDVLWIGNGYVP